MWILDTVSIFLEQQKDKIENLVTVRANRKAKNFAGSITNLVH
jgi:hypothetical protein